jgi:phosphatidylglycerol:prolipoprotein diacylglycerol transferase
VHPVLFHIGAVVIPAYGALAALGVLAGLFAAERAARIAGLNAAAVWNLCVIALFTALAVERLLLVVANFAVLRVHPTWAFALAMVHHPLLAAVGAWAGILAAVFFARRKALPLRATADVLAGPLALGLAFEQLGALLAGSGWGVDAPEGLPWAVTYTSTLAARWSGTPLGVALHPVQAYAAVGFFLLAVLAFVGLRWRRQEGDVAGAWLMGFGVVVFWTELWRDAVGRGRLLHGALDGTQAGAVAAVLAGAWLLRERAVNTAAEAAGSSKVSDEG